MDSNTAITLTLVCVIILFGFFYWHFVDGKKRKERAQLYRLRLPEIIQATDQFARHLSLNSERILTSYFTKSRLTSWSIEFSSLYEELKPIEYQSIGLSVDEVEIIRTFFHYSSKASALRDDFNSKFIAKELKDFRSFFDNTNGSNLDNEQRVAIVTDEDNNIVIAGAGSGKTTTIVGKVKYLTTRYNVLAEKILLISFTNKSAATLSARIGVNGVDAKTFHKFGKNVITAVEGQPRMTFEESQFKPFLRETFDSLITNEQYLKKVTDYFSEHMRQPKSEFEFETHGDYIQFLKDNQFRTYKEIQPNGMQTFFRQIVKSVEECKIANFLLFHSVDYHYEAPFEVNVADATHGQWRPDFTVMQGDKIVYIEHFAINRTNDIPRFFAKDGEIYDQAKQRYLAKRNWARQTAQTHGAVLIETYSYEMSEGILYDNLHRNLTEAGIELRLKTPQEIWDIIKRSAKDEVDCFIDLFATFITLLKSNNYRLNEIRTKALGLADLFHRNRNLLFLDIIEPLYRAYQSMLEKDKRIDFSDMVNIATGYINTRKFTDKYEYIIIDEFQDISIGRYHLVKALKETNPSCKLFCVGDDWQSIYRFTGSDIALFKDFENYFGATVTTKIQTTYRFHEPLITKSSEFILRNSNQSQKHLRSNNSTKTTKYDFSFSESLKHNDDTSALEVIFDKYSQVVDISSKKFLILGRYGFDVNRISDARGFRKLIKSFDSEANIIYETAYSDLRRRNMREHEKIIVSYRNDVWQQTINAEFLTVHKAKGLEADVVIVLNCNAGKHGFPSEISDDPLLNLLLSEADQFPNGEERRLFYVAMTRAKEAVHFVADNVYRSKFVIELDSHANDTSDNLCPICRNGIKKKLSEGTARNGNQWIDYGCSNYFYGCSFKNREWINHNSVRAN